MTLTDQVVLVTGARGGIGSAIVETLLDGGAKVLATDIQPAPDATVGASEGRLHYVAADLSEAGAPAKLVDSALAAFGRLDALVNNAAWGIADGLFELTGEDWDKVFAINVKAAFFLAQSSARHMVDRGSGKIINVASELAHVGHPAVTPYAASKAAVLNLTRSLAVGLAPKVQVNAVCPGPTDTQMLRDGPDDLDEMARLLPIGRLLKPREVAMTIAFLLGPGGDAYTGQHLDPNGGATMA